MSEDRILKDLNMKLNGQALHTPLPPRKTHKSRWEHKEQVGIQVIR
jgi:hypothetical protein